METLEQLEEKIEELEQEIEDQKLEIKKFEQDQEETGKDHTDSINWINRKIHNLRIEIQDLEYRINSQD